MFFEVGRDDGIFFGAPFLSESPWRLIRTAIYSKLAPPERVYFGRHIVVLNRWRAIQLLFQRGNLAWLDGLYQPVRLFFQEAVGEVGAAQGFSAFEAHFEEFEYALEAGGEEVTFFEVEGTRGGIEGAVGVVVSS